MNISFGDRPTVLLEVNFKSAVGTSHIWRMLAQVLRSCRLHVWQSSLSQLSYTPIAMHPIIPQKGAYANSSSAKVLKGLPV